MSKVSAREKGPTSALKKMSAIIIVSMMVMCCLVITYPDEIEAVAGPTSGSCGANLDWELDTKDGHLTITGTGAMFDYVMAGPWNGNIVRSVTFPDGITKIGDYAFYSTNLTSVVIPNNVTIIGNYAFNRCYDLETVTIGTGVTTINSYAFSECSKLGSVAIPDNVTAIYASAFYDCQKLTTVTIGTGVSTIGDGTFDSCLKLTAINVAEGNAAYSSVDGVLFNKAKTTLVKYPGGKTGESYTIPATVTGLGTNAFSHSDLTTITFSEILGDIGEGFSSCLKLTTYVVPEGNAAYSSVNGVLFNKAKNTLIHYPAEKTGESYTIPDGVTTVSAASFVYNKGLRTVTIPDAVTSLGASAFQGSAITSVTIGSGITTIGNSVFAGCNCLTTANLPNTLTAINDKAFTNCSGLKTITIPNTVTSIGEEAFSECHSLATVNMGTGLTTLGEDAFSYCYSLGSITIPNGVTVIPDDAFRSCQNLGSITIPDNVTTIGDAFYGCSGLTAVSIGKGVTNISDRAFSGCLSLTSFSVANANTSYTTKDGVLFNKETTTLVQYPLGKTDEIYTIPDTVENILGQSFHGCPHLKTVKIGPGVSSVAYGAFSNCGNLTGFSVSRDNTHYCAADGVLLNKAQTTLVQYPAGKTDETYNVPSTVTMIADDAFSGCSHLKTVNLSEDLLTIGDGAFGECFGITTIYIPAKVNSIGTSFGLCSNLKSFSVSSTNNNYSTIDGVLYSKDLTRLICCPMAYTGPLYVPSGTNFYDLLISVMFCNGITEFTVDSGSLFTVKDRTLCYWNYTMAYPSCDEAESYNIPYDISSIVGTQMSLFNSAENLKDITVDSDCYQFSSVEGCLYDHTGATLVTCPSGRTSYVFPSNVNNTSMMAFSGGKVEEVKFTSGMNVCVTPQTFYNCTSLKKIVIEDGADVHFCTDSIYFTDDGEHTIYVVAPDGYKLDTSNFSSNIKIVYGEPPSSSFPWLYIGIGAAGVIVLAGVAIILIRRHK